MMERIAFRAVLRTFVLGSAAACALAVGCIGCKKDDANTDTSSDKRSAPPPPPTASPPKPGACAAGGGEVNDAISAPFFPRVVGTYCVDPQGETKTYGAKAKLSMDEICTTAFDGGCEVYKRFGLKRTVGLRYIDGSGGAGTVEIYLSEFNDVTGAYGIYTNDVVADADPADPTAPRVLAAGGAGAIGNGRAYVWRGPYLLELQYSNDQESPEQLSKSSDAILSAVGKAIGAKIPGTVDAPASVKALPDAKRIPNGISFIVKDPLGFPNVGQGAIGYYKDGEKRYRVVALARDEADRAKDALKTIRGRPGALPVAGIGDEAVLLVVSESKERPKSEYVFARKAALVIGVGDEELAAKPDDGPEKQAVARLSKDEKIAKLKTILGAIGGASAGADGGAKK